MPLMLAIGDITKIKTDVIVNCTNENIDMTGMVAQKIIEVAGVELEAECIAHRTKGILQIGKCFYTKAYKLPCKEVIHVAGPDANMSDANHLLASCYRQAIALAKSRGHKSIAFPIISSGGHGFEMDEAIKVAIQRLSVELSREDLDIYLVFYEAEDLNLARPIYERIFNTPYTGYTGFPDPEKEIRAVINIPHIVWRHLKECGIVYIDQLCASCAADLFTVVGIGFSTFKRLVQVMSERNLFLDDYDPGFYGNLEVYLRDKEKEWVDYCTQREYNKNLNKCTLKDISELELPGRILTLLRKQNINTVKELISLTREQLMDMKQFGVKGVALIEAALMAHELLLRGDLIYECSKCGIDYPDIINVSSKHYCSKCAAKRERIEGIDRIKITLMEPEYSSFERLSSGFILYANIKNISEELIKVKLKEFYIESNGRQIAKKYHLSGYYFDEESIMPISTRTAAMIWDVENFADKKLKEGDMVFITLYLPQEKKNLMYKFTYGEEGMVIDDYFED